MPLRLKYWHCFDQESWTAVNKVMPSETIMFLLMGMTSRMGVSPTSCMHVLLGISNLSSTQRSTLFLQVNERMFELQEEE